MYVCMYVCNLRPKNAFLSFNVDVVAELIAD